MLQITINMETFADCIGTGRSAKKRNAMDVLFTLLSGSSSFLVSPISTLPRSCTGYSIALMGDMSGKM